MDARLNPGRNRVVTTFGWLLVVMAIGVIVFIVGSVSRFRLQHFSIVNGVAYDVISFEPEDVINDHGRKIPAYRVKITDETCRKSQTKIVPRGVMTEDETLPPKMIVWDEPLYLRGRTYNLVRWNPEGIFRSLPSSGT